MAQLKLFGSARGGARVAKRGKKDKPARQKKPLKALAIVLTVLLCLEGLYFLCIYSNIPFIVKYRTIYINTAMNTMRHQWLATYFIPDNVIDKVRYEYGLQVAASNGKESQWGNADASAEVTKPTVNEIEAEIVEEEKPDPEEQARLAREAFFEVFWEIDEASMDAYVAEHPDVIANGWDSIHINEAGIEDEGTNIESIYGEQVLGIDAANGVLLLRVKDKGYRGVLAVGKNPAALSVETCSTYGTVGQKIGVTAEEHDGVLAMNASGFLDPGGNGNGGTVAGYAMSNGEEYGSHFTQWAYKRIELREDNRFYIKDASAPTTEGTTDATEFQPAMIIDGVKYTTDVWTDSNPRACIGQSDKYEILMLVIEGRLWLEGINGTSVNTCSDILLQHGCMQAMNLDGGSSAMMWFDGKYVMRSSSPDNRYNGGRPAPNAWVYKAAGTFEE